ncbi:MAG: hypothetical protein LBJ01_05155 [Tannerella sp.]|jgi:hypothetical protein|nr:hypothetical protein [Tannerella sp.]
MRLPRLLILSFTDARRDPRVFRQAGHLRSHFAVTLAGLNDPKLDGVNFLPIRRRPKTFFSQGYIALNLLFGNYNPALCRFESFGSYKTHDGNFDLVLVNDAEPLPLGFALAKGAPVIFDAHEYYPKEFENSLRWKLFFQRYMTRLCADYIPRCAGMTTVCSGIAEEYYRVFRCKPEVVYNAPEYMELSIHQTQPGIIRMIHHGTASRDRHIELMLDMMRYVDPRFRLDMMLVGDTRYIDRLKCRTAGIHNICWREPVAMPDICRTINTYDIGLFLVTPSTFNLFHCLPNKFFEFIQARLGIAVGPSPEMASLIKKYDLGVVAADFSAQSLATALNALTDEDIIRFKRNAATVATLYNAEKSMKNLTHVLMAVAG